MLALSYLTVQLWVSLQRSINLSVRCFYQEDQQNYKSRHPLVSTIQLQCPLPTIRASDFSTSQSSEMIRLPKMRVALMRHRHARTKEDDPRLAELQRQLLQSEVQAKEAVERKLVVMEKRAKNLGCQPRSGS